MTTPPMPPTTEIALLRSELLLPLTRIEGDVRLVLQRIDQGDQRAAEHALELRRLDDRQDKLERDYAARAELQHEIAVIRADMEKKSARTIQIIGIIAGACGTAAGVLAAIIIALVN